MECNIINTYCLTLLSGCGLWETMRTLAAWFAFGFSCCFAWGFGVYFECMSIETKDAWEYWDCFLALVSWIDPRECSHRIAYNLAVSASRHLFSKVVSASFILKISIVLFRLCSSSYKTKPVLSCWTPRIHFVIRDAQKLLFWSESRWPTKKSVSEQCRRVGCCTISVSVWRKHQANG